MSDGAVKVKIGADTSELDKALDGIGKSLSGIGIALTALGASIAVGLGKMISGAIEAGHEVAHMAEKTGVAIEEFGGLQLSAEKGGTSIEAVVRTFRMLSQAMTSAEDGTGKMGDKLKQFGIEAVDRSTGKMKDMKSMLYEIADRFATMPDGAEKTTMAIKMFGRAGMEMIPVLNEGSKGLRENEELSKKFGTTLSKETVEAYVKAKDAAIEFTTAKKGLGMAITEQILPTLTAMKKALADVMIWFQNIARNNPVLVTALTTLGSVIGTVSLAAGGLILVIPKLIGALTALAAHPIVAVMVALAAAITVAKAAIDKMNEATSKLIAGDKQIIQEQSQTWGALAESAAKVGIYGKAWEDLTAKYKNNANAMAAAVLEDKEGTKWKDALNAAMTKQRRELEATAEKEKEAAERAAELAKLEEDHVAFLAKAGIVTVDDYNKKLADLAERKKYLNELLKTGQITFSQYQKGMAAVGEETKKLTGSTHDLVTELSIVTRLKYREEIDNISAALKTMRGTMAPGEADRLTERLIALTDEMGTGLDPEIQKMVKAHVAWKKAQEEQKAASEGMRASLDQTAPAVQENAEAWSEMLKRLAGAKETLPDVTLAIDQQAVALKKYAGGEFLSAAERQIVAIKQLYDEAQKAGKPAQWMPDPKEVWARMEDIKKAQETGVKDIAKVTNAELGGAFKTLAGIFRSLSDDMSEGWQRILSGLGSVFDAIGNKVKGLASGVKLSIKDIAEAAGPMLGDIGASIGGLISGKKSNYGGTGSAIGGTIGSMFGPIGGAIGSLAGGLLGGLFGKKEHKTEEQRAAEEMNQTMGHVKDAMASVGKISDDTAKHITELGKQIGGAAAQSKLYSEVIEDVGVHEENFELLLRGASGAINQWEAGTLSAKDASEAFGKSFTLLAQGAEKLGKEGSKAWSDFMRNYKESGLAVGEVADFINAKLGIVKAGSRSAADGILAMAAGVAPEADKIYEANTDLEEKLKEVQERMDKMTDKGSEDYLELQATAKSYAEQIAANKDKLLELANSSKEGLATVERQAVRTYEIMLKNGASQSEALEALGPALDVILLKHKELGTEASVGIQKLLHIREVTTAHKELMDAVDGNLAVMNALAATGDLDADVMKDVSKQAADYYKQLISAGLSSDEAYAKLGPTLQRIQDLAAEYGFTLDENTLKLIAEAKETGAVKDTQKSATDVMKEGFEKVVDVLDKIAEKLGATVGGAIDKTTERIRNMADGMKGVPDVIDTWKKPLDDVGETIDGISDSLGDIGSGIPGAGAGLDIGQYAEGGIAFKPQLATIAERGPELIVPISQVSAARPLGPEKLDVTVNMQPIEIDLKNRVEKIVVDFLRVNTPKGFPVIHPNAVKAF